MARNSEAIIQNAIVGWIRACAPQAICHSIPNGIHCSKSQGALAVYTGLLKGALDLVVIDRCEPFYIEVKTDTGDLSKEQKEFMARLDTQGVPWIVAKSIDDVRAAFDRWGIETREVAA